MSQPVRIDGPWGAIPALLTGAPSAARAAILLRYGLRARMEVQLAEAERLASAGYAVIIPEAPSHGLREDGFLEHLSQTPEPQARARFLELVARTAEETPALVAHLRGLGARRIIDSGISMGGFVALAAPSVAPEVSGVIALLASPVWDEHPRSPHRTPEAWARTPLLAITADEDQSVPPAPLRAFCTALGPTATSLEYPGGHTMAGDDWHHAWARAITWLDALR